jgi:hypothetical protein
MILERVTGEFPIVFTEFDQTLREFDRILEVNVHIDHTVADQ